jgi:hypothetical protein
VARSTRSASDDDLAAFSHSAKRFRAVANGLVHRVLARAHGIRKSGSGRGRVSVPSASSSLHSWSSRMACMAAFTSYPNLSSISARCPACRALCFQSSASAGRRRIPRKVPQTSGKKNMPVAHHFRPDSIAECVPGKPEVQRRGIGFTSQPGPFSSANNALLSTCFGPLQRPSGCRPHEMR